jgi:ABC-type multidrug transport system ATPase subunit
MLRLERIAKWRAGVPVLADVSLDVAAGECVAVTGPPSSLAALMRVAGTLIPPDSGSVRIDGIDAVRDPYRARQRVAYVGPTAVPCVPGMRLGDLRNTANAGRGAIGNGVHYWAVLDHAGVDPSVRATRLPPAGQRALAIALALDTRAPVVLMDDPFSVLDDEWAARAIDWIAIAGQAGRAIVIAVDDVSRIEGRCTRVVCLAS